MSLKFNKIAIIGCGGVAAHIIPALVTTYNLVLVDGDTYEPKNTIRQLAAYVGDGKNKAATLKSMYEDKTDKSIEVFEQYLTESMQLPADVDVILVAVDNHDARIIAKKHAEQMFIPLIWGANEEFDPQAFLFRPEDKGTYKDPFIRMKIEPDGRGPGQSCTTPEAIEERPQLPIANHVAGGYMLSMLHCMLNISSPNNLIAEIIGVDNKVYSRKFGELEEVKMDQEAALA